jgi:hypothetical protein
MQRKKQTPKEAKGSTPAYRFAGEGGCLHTLVSVVVRSIEIEETPAGRMVSVSATMGESETNTSVVRFRLTEREALNVNILERVCRHCGRTDIRMVSVPGIETSAGVCFDCRKEWRA